MRKSVWLVTSGVASLMLLSGVGCQKQERGASADSLPGEDPVAAVDPGIPIDESPLFDLYERVDSLLMDGETNQANTIFLNALTDPALSVHQESLFSTLIRYFIFTDQLEQAKTHYLNALRVTPEIAEPGFDVIYGAYVNRGDFAGALDWARVLATQDIGDHLRIMATDWLISSLYRNDQLDDLDAEVESALRAFPAERLAPILDRIAREALMQGATGVVERLLAAVAASPKAAEAPYVEMRLTLQIRIDAEAGAWEKIVADMPALLVEVADQPLQQALSHVFQRARRAGRHDMVDAVAAAVIEADPATERSRTRNLAAREWVAVLFADDPDGRPRFPGRIETLLAIQLEPRQIYSIFSRHFYDIINDTDVVKASIPLMDALYPLLSDEPSQGGLRSYQLDACFVAEDYARALQILEKGVSNQDEDWHAMAVVKVRAHQAEQEGRYEDAVRNYQAFMKTIKPEGYPDPSSDIFYSQATLMGNNEKRIGDLYQKAGRADAAADAYESARDWYAQALETNEKGAETEAYIRAQMMAVPGAETAVPEPAVDDGAEDN